MAINVGTIGGRHPLPVEHYLLGETLPGQTAYDAAFGAAALHAASLARGTSVALYYTGLTGVTLGAIDGYAVTGIAVTLMRYDAGSGEYVPLHRGDDHD